MSKANRRFYRTLALGVLALGVLVWSAIEQFGIAWQVMLDLLIGTLLVAAAVMALAALCVITWIALRKLLRRNDE
ncbi:MAG: hypothetical protein KDI17_00445 [Halioglobus sp.]|nr:hypothetical protein [Halioglobus sp.]